MSDELIKLIKDSGLSINITGEVEKKPKSKFCFLNVMKFITFIAIYSGVFGLGYQKGEISEMGLGNMAGSYDLREVYNSAIYGYLDFLLLLSKHDIWDSITIEYMLISVGVFSVIGAFLSFMYRVGQNPKRCVKFKKKLKAIRFEGVLESYPLSSSFFGLIGALGTFLIPLFIGLFQFVFLLFLLPSFLGYAVGEKEIKDAKLKPPCGYFDEKMRKQTFISECTQIRVANKRVMGRIVLENQIGFFIQTNSAFLYLTKDGKNCISSRYIKTETLKGKTSEDINKTTLFGRQKSKNQCDMEKSASTGTEVNPQKLIG